MAVASSTAQAYPDAGVAANWKSSPHQGLPQRGSFRGCTHQSRFQDRQQGLIKPVSQRVYRYGSLRFWRANQDEATGLELRAGLNVLVFKTLFRGDTEGQLSLWITDAHGRPNPGLRVTLDPDETGPAHR